MNDVLQLLPEGVSLYEKTSGLAEPWLTVVYVIAIIGLVVAIIGVTVMCAEQEKVGIPILIAGLVIMMCSVFVGMFGNYEDRYKVTVSENANIDALEENFNIIKKDDFLWTVKLKYDGTKKMWQD